MKKIIPSFLVLLAGIINLLNSNLSTAYTIAWSIVAFAAIVHIAIFGTKLYLNKKSR